MLLTVVLAVALAVDGGTPLPPVYYRIPAGALLDLRDGDAPFALPASVLLPEPSFNAVDAELKRLQSAERTPPQIAVIPVKGYLIMAGIVMGVGIGLGFGLGWYFSDQRRR